MPNKTEDTNNTKIEELEAQLDPELKEIIGAVRKSIAECRAAGITGLDQIHKTVEAHGEVVKRIMERKKVDRK